MGPWQGVWGMGYVRGLCGVLGVRGGMGQKRNEGLLGDETWVVPPPLAQARPRSQKSGQNGGSTPTPCLDKAVHARDTCDSQTGNNIVSHG